jgi:hypothetical protein
MARIDANVRRETASKWSIEAAGATSLEHCCRFAGGFLPFWAQ